MLLFEDLNILIDIPSYPNANNFGIKQIDVNESIFNSNSNVLFINKPNKKPILKVFNMQGIQIGNDFLANEIKYGTYIFSISYLILKTLHGLIAGNYLISVIIDQESDFRIVDLKQAHSSISTGGFR